jgi:hypothetical protein
MQSLIAALIVMAAAGFAIVLPRSKGCRAWLVRFPALLIGSVGPLFILWPRPFPDQVQVLTVVVALVLVVASVAALTLVGLGWQVILNRSEGAEAGLSTALFDPALYFGGMTNLSADDSIDSCFLGIAVLVVGALFILGLLLAGVIERYLLPGEDASAKKVLRVILAFGYGAAIVVGIFYLLNTVLVERLVAAPL